MTMTTATPGIIEVVDQGRTIRFTYEDMMRYHGPAFPGGVAHAFKVMERAFPMLDGSRPPERRGIAVHTAFTGPGARDAFELATHASTEGRYHVDPALERPERGRTLERYVFRVSHRGVTVVLRIREGFVADEFIELTRRADRSDADEHRLGVLRQEMADRLLAAPASDVYDADV
ncbi:MAG TPA: hypothetical protein VFO65_04625 [Acidimicrobiales bacterium]|nr:hypothetical protein [Acidimicrobiales bacterium]